MLLKEFLATRSYTKGVSKISACIGADPSIGSAGWALVLRCQLPISGYTDYVVSCGTYKSSTAQSLTDRIFMLKELFGGFVTDVQYQIIMHNDKNLVTIPQIQPVFGALEVPAYLKGGKQRLNRDLVQRDSITAMRLAFREKGLFIVGDDDESPVRPNQVHDLAGVAKVKDTKEWTKKSEVKKWLRSNTAVLVDDELFDNDDVSDATGIAVVGLNKMSANA